MSDETNAMENTANAKEQEVQYLMLDDKRYKLDDLTEECLQHLNNIHVVDTQIEHYNTTLQLLGVSKNTLTAGLRSSLADVPFEKVEKEKTESPE